MGSLNFNCTDGCQKNLAAYTCQMSKSERDNSGNLDISMLSSCHQVLQGLYFDADLQTYVHLYP